MKTVSYPVVIEKDKDGYFAWCPNLQGCMTQGDSYEEARANIEDAIQLYLDDLDEAPRTPDAVSVTVITIAISPSHAKAPKAHRR